MYTRCPECESVLRIETEQLRKAGGRVRCGRCHHTFDGLAARITPSPTPVARASHSAAGASAARANGSGKKSLHDAPGDARLSRAKRPASPYSAADGDPGFDVGDLEEAVQPAGFEIRQAPPARKKPSAERRAATHRRRKTSSDDTLRGWIALLLLALLALQGLHQIRDSLATHATIGPWVTWTYERLGNPVYAAWPLDDFVLRGIREQLHAEDGSLEFNAELGNVGRQEMPLPLLRLSLVDAGNRTVASRVLTPLEYTSGNRPDSLRPAGTLRVQFAVQIPQTETYSSYRLDVCRPSGTDGVICNDAW